MRVPSFIQSAPSRLPLGQMAAVARNRPALPVAAALQRPQSNIAGGSNWASGGARSFASVPKGFGFPPAGGAAPNHPSRVFAAAMSGSDGVGRVSPNILSFDPATRKPEGTNEPILVDSGIGGAMAGMDVAGNVKQFAAEVCLPIGDKERPQVISYTAQMIFQGLVTEGHNNVIIACNTASTAADEALAMVGAMIRLQTGDEAGKIFDDNSFEMARMDHLAKQMDDFATDRPGDPDQLGPGGLVRKSDTEFLRGMVHEIVSKTCEKTADAAMDAMLPKDGSQGKDSFRVVVDSTVGTVSSKAYPDRILDKLADKMQGEGYSLDISNSMVMEDGEGGVKPDVRRHMSEYSADTKDALKARGLYENEKVPPMELSAFRAVFTSETPGEPDKTVEVFNRGDPAWVPVIERVSENVETMFQGLATDAADALDEMPGFEPGVPDYQMMCCTHYPAMKATMEAEYSDRQEWAWQGETLTQTTVVREMAEEMGKTEDPEDPLIEIKRGMSGMGADTRDQTEASVKKGGSETVRTFAVDGMSAKEFASYQAVHKLMEFERAASDPDSGVKGANVPGGQVRNFYPETEPGRFATKPSVQSPPSERGLSMTFERDWSNPEPSQRANARLVSSAPNFDAGVEALKGTGPALDIMKSMGIESSDQGQQLIRMAETAKLITGGESRGMDILAARHDPVPGFINSAATIAEALHANNERSEDAKQPIAIVTGFTVVDDAGDPINGENDGPPGAVTMAKQMVDSGSPVRIVCDSGSLKSVLAAAEGIGLSQDGKLNDKVSIAYVTHGPAVDVEPMENVQAFETIGDLKGDLAKPEQGQPVELMVSIERPSIGQDNDMHSMSGANISRFNLDMSPLFDAEDASWKTIGIGDGGNEIGMANIADTITTFRKPDFATAVNNGDLIAAKVGTDMLVKASVSNNGGVALAIAVDGMLQKSSTDADTDGPSDPRERATNIVEGYKGTIQHMFDQGISIDGVTKKNAMTVDGRTLLRPEGQGPKDLGSAEATHQDMFDRVIDAAAAA